jgi:hypothetical protein
MLSVLKHTITDRLFLRSINKYRSKMGVRLAAPFAAYLEKCRATYTPHPISQQLIAAAERFSSDGFVAFWNEHNKSLADSILSKIKSMEAAGNCPWNDDYLFTRDPWQEFPEIEELFKSGLNDFMETLYGSHAKIFYAKLYKAVRTSSEPEGSQLWHSDGGPGTCTNVMFYLSEGTRENGAMEVVSWQDSIKIFADEKVAMRQMSSGRTDQSGKPLQRIEARRVLTDWYGDQIEERRIRVSQPTGEPGMVLAFRNNTIHKGGFPSEGHVRYVIVFHIYPSMTPMLYEKYRDVGVPKTGAFPPDPAF